MDNINEMDFCWYPIIVRRKKYALPHFKKILEKLGALSDFDKIHFPTEVKTISTASGPRKRKVKSMEEYCYLRARLTDNVRTAIKESGGLHLVYPVVPVDETTVYPPPPKAEIAQVIEKVEEEIILCDVGDKIQIIDGALRGQFGYFCGYTAQGMATIETKLFKGRIIECHPYHIKKIDEDFE